MKKTLITGITGQDDSDLATVIKEIEPGNQPRRNLDVTYAKKYFGFHAKTNFDKRLKTTIDCKKKR